MRPDGEPLGEPTRVTANMSGSYNPTVTWTGQEYGVAWMDKRKGNKEIFFTRIDHDGNEIGDGQCRLVENPPASSGTECDLDTPCPLTGQCDLNSEVPFAPCDADSDCPTGACQFVEQVCNTFPDWPIVFRPHPKWPRVTNDCRQLRALTRHKQASFISTHNSYHWAARASAVVGINSTVLIEALTYYKPVYAIGKGVFSSNGVMLDAYRQPEQMREVLDYKPDPIRIRRSDASATELVSKKPVALPISKA